MVDCCTSCEPGRSTTSSKYPGGWTHYDGEGKESSAQAKSTLLPFRDMGWVYEMDATPDFDRLVWANGVGPLCELGTAQDIYAKLPGYKFVGLQDRRDGNQDRGLVVPAGCPGGECGRGKHVLAGMTKNTCPGADFFAPADVGVTESGLSDFTDKYPRGKVTCKYAPNAVKTPAQLQQLLSLRASGAVHPDLADALAANYCITSVSGSCATGLSGERMTACSRFRSTSPDGEACQKWARAAPAAADAAYMRYCASNSSAEDCDCVSRNVGDTKVRRLYKSATGGAPFPVADACWFAPCKPSGYALVPSDVAAGALTCPSNVCVQVVQGWAERDVKIENVDAHMECYSEYAATQDATKYVCDPDTKTCVRSSSGGTSLALCKESCVAAQPPPQPEKQAEELPSAVVIGGSVAAGAVFLAVVVTGVVLGVRAFKRGKRLG